MGAGGQHSYVFGSPYRLIGNINGGFPAGARGGVTQYAVNADPHLFTFYNITIATSSSSSPAPPVTIPSSSFSHCIPMFSYHQHHWLH